MSMDKRPSTAQEEQASHDDKCFCVECEHINYKSKPKKLVDIISSNIAKLDNDIARGTGRTKRMLLSAALALSQNNELKIIIVADTIDYANELKHHLLSILSVTFGNEFTSGHCQSRIKCESHRGLEDIDCRGYTVYTDHYRKV